MNEKGTLTTLRKVLPSPCFRYIRSLIFNVCHNLSEIPNNISLLVLSYTCLKALIVFQDSCFLKLVIVKCFNLYLLFHNPFNGSMFGTANLLRDENKKKHGNMCTFLLLDCIKLDQHSFFPF